ncbi:MAG TPA: hypothetical protein VNJ70_10975 [Thermoanaerobaculia bacterium]|nr:hypothetical protein [Thermoanaerobaculia bacterium]
MPGFDLLQDPDFQRRTWAAQRVGRMAMALVVLAALAGLVGTGPLSETSAGDGERLTVEYDRFVRRLGENRLTLKVAPGAAAGPEVRLWIDAPYAQRMEVEAVTPEPERMETTADRLTLVFALARPGEGLEAVLDLRSRSFGPVRGAVCLAGGPAVPIAQFVYP